MEGGEQTIYSSLHETGLIYQLREILPVLCLLSPTRAFLPHLSLTHGKSCQTRAVSYLLANPANPRANTENIYNTHQCGASRKMTWSGPNEVKILNLVLGSRPRALLLNVNTACCPKRSHRSPGYPRKKLGQGEFAVQPLGDRGHS